MCVDLGVFEPPVPPQPSHIVTIEVDETTLRVYDHREHLIKHVPRTSRKEVTRHKDYGHTTNHKTG